MKKKMSFKLKTYLGTLVICWPLYSLLVFMIYKMHFLPFINNLSGGMKFLFIIIMGFLFISLVHLITSLVSPRVKVQNETEKELETNGYTERYIELATQLINFPGTNRYSNLAKKYIMQIANAYLVKEDFQAALNTINMLDPTRLKEGSVKNNVNLLYLLQYFDVQICVSEGLKDVKRAKAVFDDALPYIEKSQGKMTGGKLIIYEIYIHYYSVMQEYAKALTYVDDTMKRGKVQDIRFIGNLWYAYVYTKMKNFDEASRYISLAESENETAAGRDYIDGSKRALEREMKAINSSL